MKARTLFLLLGLATGCDAGAAGPPRYTLTDLGIVYNFSPSPTYDPHINNSGQIALTRPLNSPAGLAWLQTGGVWQSLGTLGGDRSTAVDINDQGAVVGSTSTVNNSARAFIYTGGSMIDLGFNTSGQNPEAIAVNNAGWVAGEAIATVSGAPGGVAHRALRRIGATTTTIGVLPPTGFGSFNTSHAVDIDSAGTVLGFCEGTIVRGFVAPLGGPMQDLGGIPNYLFNYPTAMNDRGLIVGYFLYTDGGNPGDPALRLPYLRQPDGTYVILGNLGGRRTTPAAINESGRIVGASDANNSANGSAEAFLVHDGVMYRLNDLVPDRKGFDLDSASDINDRGQIVGKASDGLFNRHAFLLTPIDESPSLEVRGKPRRTSRSVRVVLRGTADDANDDLARVEVKAGKSRWKNARGTETWRFVVRGLKPGRNVIKARAVDSLNARSKPARITVIRQ